MESATSYEAPSLTVLGSVETLTRTVKYYGGNDGVMFAPVPGDDPVPIGPVSSVTAT